MERALSPHNLKSRWQVVALVSLFGAGIALPAAAQTLECPKPETMAGPGVLKESPAQIAKTGNRLADGDGVNRASEIAADLRKRYPGVSNGEIENYLVAAYCPVAAKLDGLSVAERQARVDRFAREASVAVNGR